MDHLDSDGSRTAEIVTPAAENAAIEFECWLEELSQSAQASHDEARKIAPDSWGAGYDCGYADALRHAFTQFHALKASGLTPDRTSTDAQSVAR